ncbi:MAG: hypothetical protein AAGF48_14130 [Pseudomonadota bacterium]
MKSYHSSTLPLLATKTVLGDAIAVLLSILGPPDRHGRRCFRLSVDGNPIAQPRIGRAGIDQKLMPFRWSL